MGYFSMLWYSIIKSRQLKKLQSIIEPQNNERLRFDDLIGPGADRHKEALEEYLDLCATDPNIMKLLQEYSLSQDDLCDIYLKSKIHGLGHWVNGHYAALSTIAYYESLRFYILAEQHDINAFERCEMLMQYWCGQIPQGWLNAAANQPLWTFSP